MSLCNKKIGSQFWRGQQQVKDKFKWGATFSLGNGENILFWEDVWAGNIPLKLEFPKLYDYCYNKNCLVSDCWVEGEWRIELRRSLDMAELLQWEQLLHTLNQKIISDASDQVSCVLERSGSYSTRSMYRLLSDGGTEWKNAATMEKQIAFANQGFYVANFSGQTSDGSGA